MTEESDDDDDDDDNGDEEEDNTDDAALDDAVDEVLGLVMLGDTTADCFTAPKTRSAIRDRTMRSGTGVEAGAVAVAVEVEEEEDGVKGATVTESCCSVSAMSVTRVVQRTQSHLKP